MRILLVAVVLGLPATAGAVSERCESLVSLIAEGWRAVDPGELVGVEAECLVLLRNTPFARHGRPFKLQVIREFFERQTWYTPDPAYSDKSLTEVDHATIGVILAVEKARPTPQADAAPYDVIWSVPFGEPLADGGARPIARLDAVDERGRAIVHDALSGEYLVIDATGRYTGRLTHFIFALGNGLVLTHAPGFHRDDESRDTSPSWRVEDLSGAIVSMSVVYPVSGKPVGLTTSGLIAVTTSETPQRWYEVSSTLNVVGEYRRPPPSAVSARLVDRRSYRVSIPRVGCVLVDADRALPRILPASRQAAVGDDLLRVNTDGTLDVWAVPPEGRAAQAVVGLDGAFYSLLRADSGYRLVRWNPAALSRVRLPAPAGGRPTFSISVTAWTARVGQATFLSMRAEDPAGDHVYFTAKGLPPGFKLEPAGPHDEGDEAVATGTPSAADVGHHELLVTAHSGEEDCATTTQKIVLDVMP